MEKLSTKDKDDILKEIENELDMNEELVIKDIDDIPEIDFIDDEIDDNDDVDFGY